MARTYQSLRGTKDFAALFRFGRRAGVGCLKVYWATPRYRQGVRWGIVISTKISKRSTVRNRFRRMIHGALERCVWTAPCDGIVQFVRRPDNEKDILSALWKVFRRARVPYGDRSH